MRLMSIFGLNLMLSSFVMAAAIDVDVKGMTCGMCVESITKELNATKKVNNIQVSLETKKASFEEMKGQKISDEEIKLAIKKAGYEAEKINRK